MSLEKQVYKLFAQPIFQYKIDNFESHNENLKKYIYDLYEKDKVGIQRSNVDGWHSKSFKIADTKSAAFAFFKETRNIPKYYENYDNNEINHALVIQNAIDVLNYNSEIKTNALDGMKVIEIIQKIYEEGRKK